MSYLPIEDHGVIGNLHTAALVGTDGTIDWLCLPAFDSPSVFCSILDDEKGGHFALRPVGVHPQPAALPARHQRAAYPLLLARGHGRDPRLHADRDAPGGAAQARPQRAGRPGEDGFPRRVPAGLRLRPRRPLRSRSGSRGPSSRRGRPCSLGLATDVPLEKSAKGAAGARFHARGGREGDVRPGGSRARARDRGRSSRTSGSRSCCTSTLDYWRRWLSNCTYQGRWREMVHRSALVLKLMVYDPTGALVASPTMGLPERIGGERNWDYRYTWLRDAALHALRPDLRRLRGRGAPLHGLAQGPLPARRRTASCSRSTA